MSEIAHCKSCGDPIRWLCMASGKAMPVDAQPAPGGNILILENGNGEVVSKDVAAKSTGLHVSHFVTCPHAATHRKPRQKDLFADRDEGSK